jgi:hypothetical protein
VQFINLECAAIHTCLNFRSYDRTHMEVGRAIFLGDYERRRKGATDEAQDVSKTLTGLSRIMTAVAILIFTPMPSNA